MLSFVSPSPILVLFLCWGSGCILVEVRRLWVNSNVEGKLLEIEFFFSPIDCETDLGAICVDDGFGGTQERLPQDEGCFFISTCFYNHKVCQHV
jgi:hypothetical protein